jgi:hypothetical protein
MPDPEGSEMSVLSTKTKARIGTKTAKQAAKHPKLALRGARGVRPIVWGVVNMRTRQAQRQAAAVLAAGRSVGQTVFDAGRHAARAQVPRKRTAPRVAGGVAVGATAMYFLDPASGDVRRRRVIGLITRSSGHHDEVDATNEAGGPAHPAPGHMPPEQR